MTKAARVETDHGLPAKDAEALEKIAELAMEGKSLGEIASVIQADHPEVADVTLDAYHALREERAVGEVKKLIR